MLTATLACGPSFEFLIPFLVMAGLGLLVGKTLMYYAFVQAFRFRVAAPIPMTPSQAWRIALIRAALGVLVIGGTWLALYLGNVGDAQAVGAIWTIGACERLAIWWALGAFLATLRGRRLLGWTLAGTGIDLTTDLAFYFTGKFGLTSPMVGILAIVAFIAILYRVGRRASLLNRFTASPLCRSCGYDLTGNLSGVCPECGDAVSRAPMPA